MKKAAITRPNRMFSIVPMSFSIMRMEKFASTVSTTTAAKTGSIVRPVARNSCFKSLPNI